MSRESDRWRAAIAEARAEGHAAGRREAIAEVSQRLWEDAVDKRIQGQQAEGYGFRDVASRLRAVAEALEEWSRQLSEARRCHSEGGVVDDSPVALEAPAGRAGSLDVSAEGEGDGEPYTVRSEGR